MQCRCLLEVESLTPSLSELSALEALVDSSAIEKDMKVLLANRSTSPQSMKVVVEGRACTIR